MSSTHYNRKRPRQTSGSSESSNHNPLTIAQFQESLSKLCPNVSFTPGAVDALRCVQEDFIQWLVATTTNAADNLDEAATAVTSGNNDNNSSKVAAIKQQDVLNALQGQKEHGGSASTVLSKISDQMQQRMLPQQRDNIKEHVSVGLDEAAAATATCAAPKKLSAKKSKQGRRVFSKEMEAAQERLLQCSRLKMTDEPRHNEDAKASHPSC